MGYKVEQTLIERLEEKRAALLKQRETTLEAANRELAMIDGAIQMIAQLIEEEQNGVEAAD